VGPHTTREGRKTHEKAHIISMRANRSKRSSARPRRAYGYGEGIVFEEAAHVIEMTWFGGKDPSDIIILRGVQSSSSQNSKATFSPGGPRRTRKFVAKCHANMKWNWKSQRASKQMLKMPFHTCLGNTLNAIFAPTLALNKLSGHGKKRVSDAKKWQRVEKGHVAKGKVLHSDVKFGNPFPPFSHCVITRTPFAAHLIAPWTRRK